MDKSAFLDEKGRFRTQSLFYETTYDENAPFTLKDDDFELNGKVFISMKKLYLQEIDPTEYDFATKYLLSWEHWQRFVNNKTLAFHIEKWREELEVKLRSRAVKDAISEAKKGNFQAAKWVADRGWKTRGAGRPTKLEVEHEKKVQARIDDEYGADVVRMFKR